MKSIVDLIERYYLIWVIFAIIIGITFPEIRIFSSLSPLLLAVMIGSISLTITISDLSELDIKSVFIIQLIQLSMPIIGFLLAKLLDLQDPLLIGMVIIGAVTPEFVTPVITHLAKGDTSLSSFVLLLTGFGSIVTIPLFVYILLGDNLTLNLSSLAIDLILILLIPMSIGILLKSWKPVVISKYEQYYSSVATIMLILLIGIATATNSAFILTHRQIILILTVGVLLMNITGYGLGMLSGLFLDREKKITAVFSIGMRDFAVAIALILSSELDPIIALPAVLYGIVEILTSAILVKYFNLKSNNSHQIY